VSSSVDHNPKADDEEELQFVDKMTFSCLFTDYNSDVNVQSIKLLHIHIHHQVHIHIKSISIQLI